MKGSKYEIQNHHHHWCSPPEQILGTWSLFSPFSPVSSFDWMLHETLPEYQMVSTGHGIPTTTPHQMGARDRGSFLAFVLYFLGDSFFGGGSPHSSSERTIKYQIFAHCSFSHVVLWRDSYVI